MQRYVYLNVLVLPVQAICTFIDNFNRPLERENTLKGKVKEKIVRLSHQYM